IPPVDAHAPIEIAHLGCGICCQMRRSTGASLNGTRPAQMSMSLWRGEKLMRSMPKRARSNLLAALAMNSIAQHAVPKGIGHREFERPQFTRKSRRVVIQASEPLGSTETAAGLSASVFPASVLPASGLAVNPIAALP